MERVYKDIVNNHLKNDRQMVFLAGPRQVGKTTISKTFDESSSNLSYLNWDNADDQALILAGPNAIVAHYNLDVARKRPSLIVFDEIHKFPNWRNFLKGFFDTYDTLLQIIVTGSAKLDTFRKSGDSLMGRYFPYRVHPFSVAELLRCHIPATEIRSPQPLPNDAFDALITFGGFPEPFIKQSKAFYRRWSNLYLDLLFNMDLREATRVHELSQMKILATLLKHHAGELMNYTNLAKVVKVSNITINKWITILGNFYYCFEVGPWSNNISRSLLKQPKLYLWNWSYLQDMGRRYENMVASHLLKAIHLWEDLGLGEYGLHFVRDKEKREVDFLVVKDGKPWFLVEVKSSYKQAVSPHLYYFQKQTKARHAFQVVFDLPYEDVDCFSFLTPVKVPALTFLSQLV